MEIITVKKRDKGYIKMHKIKKSYSHFPKTMAHTELGSQRQAQRISTDWGKNFAELTDGEKKQLKRSQFSFSSHFPFISDALTNGATHYGEKFFQNSNKYYYFLELPIADLCDLSLMDFKLHSKCFFRHELLRRGRLMDKEEDKYLKCIQIAPGDYISAQPLIIGFKQKKLDEISSTKLRSLQNLKTFNGDTKVINTVLIHILKPLIEPIFEGYNGGWFSCPNALQAKIMHALYMAKKKQSSNLLFRDLSPLQLRRFFLYLNCNDGSQDTDYIHLDAIDFWEHISPSEINFKHGKKYIRNPDIALTKISIYQKFYTFMEDLGLMEGAKAFPCEPQKDYPKRIYQDESRQEYTIFFKRSPEVPFKKGRKTKFLIYNS
jgi:hypothetical protein